MIVTVPRRVRDELIEYAKPWPREVGGFLELEPDAACKVRAFVPAANVALPGEDLHVYKPDPAAVLTFGMRAMLDARRRFGVFHSHPFHNAQPSRGDREHAVGLLIGLNVIYGRASGELAFYGPGWEPLRVRLVDA